MEKRPQFIRFHLAMTDEDVRTMVKPYEASSIERGEHEGLVLFDGGDHVEEDEIRERFNAWGEQFERRQKDSGPAWSFDADAYLRSSGFDPDKVRAELGDSMPRKLSDLSSTENSYDWVMKHRKVSR